jgi:hypothetical protein
MPSTNHASSNTPRRFRPLILVSALLLAPFALAQDTSRIEQQMTAEQFRNAGLDQLTSEQLANLNAWLNRTLDTETTKATRMAEDRVQHENRGFFNAGSNEPVSGHLQGTFSGFAKGRSYTLDNGQVWQQIDNASLSSAHLDSPQVRIAPGLLGTWYLQIEGYNTRAKVRRVK